MKSKAKEKHPVLVMQTLEVRDRKLARILGRKALCGQILEFKGDADGSAGCRMHMAAALLQANEAFLEKNVRVKVRKITKREAEAIDRDNRAFLLKEKMKGKL